MKDQLLNNFTKSLQFLGHNAENMNNQACDKNVFKFEDEQTEKLWKCFYAFYKKGRVDTLNEIAIDCMSKLKGE